jgi:prepilin-type N-terminal cleavage/methylation domain-containing protein
MQHNRPARRAQAGFSLMEMLVTLAILVVVMLGVMALFDMAGKISRVQVDVADLQQTLRAAQFDMVSTIKMAGRGNMPVQGPLPIPPLPMGPPWPAPDWTMPNGISVAVRNNVPDNTFLDAPANTVRVLRGTDVITIRGVLSTAVSNVLEGTFTRDASAGPSFGRGQFRLAGIARPGLPIPQSLRALDEAVTNGVPEALILIGTLDDAFYHIVELDPAASSVDVRDGEGNAVEMTIAFRSAPADGVRTAAYWELSGSNWDDPLTDVAVAGIVEEYRYGIEDVRDVPGDQTSTVSPRLVRGRFFPGTNAPYAGAGNVVQPLADNVTDLQVALGIESGGADPFFPEDNNDNADEWLYNAPGDNDLQARWRTGKLFYVRLSTTTVSARLDRDFLGPANVTVEDHSYVVPEAGAASPATPDRRHRRRTLRTVIDLRNL